MLILDLRQIYCHVSWQLKSMSERLRTIVQQCSYFVHVPRAKRLRVPSGSFFSLMSTLAAVKTAASPRDVAALLQTKPPGLTAILYTKNIADRYTTFTIPKRGRRHPSYQSSGRQAQARQHKLSLLLQDCFEEIHGYRQSSSTVSHGFRRNHSIVTNARLHRNRRWVFNIDLENFFPSIHFGRVRGFFIKDINSQSRSPPLQRFLRKSLRRNALPQGSPCSPVISNLICHILDMNVVRLAKPVGCTYSRYADDLTFSTNKKEFPAEIAVPSDITRISGGRGSNCNELIDHAHFSLNARKTRMQYTDGRQEVSGLVVNQKINVRREYRHNVRAMVHSLFTTGSFQICGEIANSGGVTLGMREGTLDELHGRLGFIDHIDGMNKKNRPQHGGIHASLKKGADVFASFSSIRISMQPGFLSSCARGKRTDVYIKHALRQLVGQFPTLAGLDEAGKPELKVRIYNYAESSTGRILRLRNGGKAISNRLSRRTRRILTDFGRKDCNIQ